MKHKYEINRRYEFEATADSVCPVPDDAEVIVWQIGVKHCQSSHKRDASFWCWDGSITHFMVISYPKTKHKAWVNCYPDGRSFSHSSREVADIHAGDPKVTSRVKCIEIEWEAE